MHDGHAVTRLNFVLEAVPVSSTTTNMTIEFSISFFLGLICSCSCNNSRCAISTLGCKIICKRFTKLLSSFWITNSFGCYKSFSITLLSFQNYRLFKPIKSWYFLKPSWAKGTRHEDTALLPVLFPVLTISITEHAPHPPSSHICLTSVWPFWRRYESKVSFILIFDASYSSLFTVNLLTVLEHLFPSISTSSKYFSSTSTPMPEPFSLSVVHGVRTGPDTVHLLIAVHSGTGSLKMKLKVQN